MSSEQTPKNEDAEAELKKQREELKAEIERTNKVLDWSIEMIKWIGGSDKTGKMYQLDCYKRAEAVKGTLKKEEIDVIKEVYIFAMKPEFRGKFMALIDEIAGLLDKFGKS